MPAGLFGVMPQNVNACSGLSYSECPVENGLPSTVTRTVVQLKLSRNVLTRLPMYMNKYILQVEMMIFNRDSYHL